LTRALKNIPNVSVSSEYFIPPRDASYFASKVAYSLYCCITSKRLASFDGIKDGKHLL
jgi:hypothetical protein